ncbi:signal recognition particle subunit FFH/SRP54 (srp54) [Candidatus Nitrososphaera evergladensis SR1]|jgi:signal recognition particle subunit SRP54|uniref:Signal recognition particle 54 kDa protein n=1 Tax=Candidatus Nitrososphaera evergladensis SR1 TaxID=1459636 RepID=A0A075MU62_9ARCH|nr:signal recognition particle receptor subunit alpha [Candidatus Nitrososphaera evergladensis]AIF82854.1 signal recognition particle subunit FFH/SRP54 (srp54) [Candidatus Nitrososphaera evergladensis SR1]
MFDNLRDGLRSALKKIVGASDINEELIDSLCKDIQRSLLLSDVKAGLVKTITDNLKQRALTEQPPKGLSRKDHIVTILYGELARMLGYSGEVITTIDKKGIDDDPGVTAFFKPGKQNVVLLLGIQGSGKTTVTAKLARWLTRHGYRVGVVGTDTWRPGALTQLKMNCAKINVEVYGEEESKDAVGIARHGLEHFKPQNLDVIIIDTAGRHKEEAGLLQEMAEMHKASTPDLALLVLDGTIGQQAYSQAEAFHKAAPLGGIIITKLDGTAKGGGALAASAATGAKVMFIGTGERIDDLEQFSPTRFVGRLLGMGDIKALLEMAKGLEMQADENQAKRVLSGKMTIEDFYAQMEQVSKIGFRNVIENMPGLSGMVKEDQLDAMQARMEKWRFIIQSMTKDEKKDPDLINEARRKRIARGSGMPESEVKHMITQYNNSKAMMKQSKGRQMQGLMRKFGLG